LKVTYVKLTKPQRLGSGTESMGATFRIGTKAGEMRLVFGAVRVGQVVSICYFAGLPRVRIGVVDAKRLARLAVVHTRTALVPANTAAPTISGTAQMGQTLTAAPGTWLTFPAGYTYQWQRCDSTGAACVAIAGATSTTYVVASDDVGSTLTVAVEAQNTYGGAAARLGSPPRSSRHPRSPGKRARADLRGPLAARASCEARLKRRAGETRFSYCSSLQQGRPDAVGVSAQGERR
jgi:hypothetical protein